MTSLVTIEVKGVDKFVYNQPLQLPSAQALRAVQQGSISLVTHSSVLHNIPGGKETLNPDWQPAEHGAS